MSSVDSACLDVVPNTRGLSVLALREAGREASEAGLFHAVTIGAGKDVSLCTLYLDAGVPINCRGGHANTPLHDLSIVTLLLDRGSRAIDEKDGNDDTPCSLSLVTCPDSYSTEAAILMSKSSLHFRARNDEGSVGESSIVLRRNVVSRPTSFALLSFRTCAHLCGVTDESGVPI